MTKYWSRSKFNVNGSKDVLENYKNENILMIINHKYDVGMF